MSKRNDRRAAEREARRIAFLQLREERARPSAAPSEPVGEPSQTESAPEPDRLAADQVGSETKPADTKPQVPKPEISAAQLAANRANARHSTGPVSSAGRARSAMNALKHGLTGKTVVLPTEDADEYQHQLDVYIGMYNPLTEEEHRLVQSINDCVWRISRIQQIETSVYYKGHLELADNFKDRTAIEQRHLIHAEAYIKYEKQIRNLNIQEARLRRNMEKDKAELARLQTIRRHNETLDAQHAARAAKPQNGFDFSTPPDQRSTTAKPDPKYQKQAA